MLSNVYESIGILPIGIGSVVDVTAPTLEEIAETYELRDRVRHAVELLPKAEGGVDPCNLL